MNLFLPFTYMTIGTLVFFVIFGLAASIQLYFLYFYFVRLAAYKASSSSPVKAGVSVIIVARNELKNLQKNLPSILEQGHPNFEVIVVNNGSWDKSQDYLEEMEALHPQLKVVKIIEQEKYPKGKKFGLTMGIKAAKNELLLLTDSDCMPRGKNWITGMSKGFESGKDLVLGYSPYLRHKGLLNLLIRYETFYTALQYLSFALAGKPYMGVGRNLAYKRSLFFEVKGFAKHNHIISGDDDLFVNETATKNNTAICIEEDALMNSTPKENFKDWFRQKKRHLSAGKYYKTIDKWRLFLLNISLLLFYSAFVLSLIYSTPLLIYITLGIFAFRLISQMIIYGLAMKKLKDIQPLYFLPFIELLYFFYYLVMGTLTIFSRRRKSW